MTTCHWHRSPAAGCNLNCSEKILIAWYFQEGEITETNHYPAIIVIWKILSFPSHNCIKPWTTSSKINLQYKHYLPYYIRIFNFPSDLIKNSRERLSRTHFPVVDCFDSLQLSDVRSLIKMQISLASAQSIPHSKIFYQIEWAKNPREPHSELIKCGSRDFLFSWERRLFLCFCEEFNIFTFLHFPIALCLY